MMATSGNAEVVAPRRHRTSAWWKSRPERLAGCFFLVLLGLGFTRLAAVQGLLIPIRVAGGSMAETLLGRHFAQVCEACGCSYRWDAEPPPEQEMVFCSNCGHRQDVAAAVLHTGDRVLVDRAAFIGRKIKRGELVALRDPFEPSRQVVKRVVGLPGERVSIRRGDLFIDGRRHRKDTEQFVASRVLVHDDAYRPAAKRGERWQPDQKGSGWKRTANGFLFRGQPDSPRPPRFSAVDGAFSRVKHKHDAQASAFSQPTHWLAPRACKPSQTDTFSFMQLTAQIQKPQASESEIHESGQRDWLTYRHVANHAGPARGREGSPLDLIPYNAGVSRTLQPVSDLGLSCQVRFMGGPGELVFELGRRGSRWRLILAPEKQAVRLLHNGELVAEDRRVLVTKRQDRAWKLEYAWCDQRLLVAFDGQEVLAHAPRDDAPRDGVEKPAWSSRPFRIGGQEIDVELSGLRIFRDRYWLPPQRAASWSCQLREDEWCLLGDNPAISVDSRHWGGLKRDQILGRVIFWPGRHR